MFKIKETITASGDSTPNQIYGGDYFLALTGNWAASSAVLKWRNSATDAWKILQEDGAAKTFTEDTNTNLKLAGGQVCVSFTGAPAGVLFELYKISS